MIQILNFFQTGLYKKEIDLMFEGDKDFPDFHSNASKEVIIASEDS